MILSMCCMRRSNKFELFIVCAFKGGLQATSYKPQALQKHARPEACSLKLEANSL